MLRSHMLQDSNASKQFAGLQLAGETTLDFVLTERVDRNAQLRGKELDLG